MPPDLRCGGLLDVPPSTAWAVANDGCGEGLALRDGYRCLDCGRWYHAPCLSRHFGRSGPGRSGRDERQAVTTWTFTLGWVLAGAGCVVRGCTVGFGYEKEADGELLFCVDHYEPGRQVTYVRYPAGYLVTEPDQLGREIAVGLAHDHGG